MQAVLVISFAQQCTMEALMKISNGVSRLNVPTLVTTYALHIGNKQGDLDLGKGILTALMEQRTAQ